jgi:CBS domain-containing protein
MHTTDEQLQEVEGKNSASADDPTYRIGRLPTAKQGVVSVSPDADISIATTLMMVHDYSQLAVLSDPTQVRGVISWKTIARRSTFHKDISKVRECLGPPNDIGIDTPLLQAIPIIAESDYVLVKSDGVLSGIVTAADLSLEFQHLTEPFLLISEIELHLHKILVPNVTLDDIRDTGISTESKKPIRGVSDLTLGQCFLVVKKLKDFATLGLRNIDKEIFVENLRNVKDIRNKVVHFDKKGVTICDMKLLRTFAGFMRYIDEARSNHQNST